MRTLPRPRRALIPLILSSLLAIMMLGSRPGPAIAQDPVPKTTASDDGEAGEKAFIVTRAFDHYVVRGGWVTIGLLIPLSITALALTIQDMFTIRHRKVAPEATVQQLTEMFGRRAYTEAVQFLRRDQSPLGRVLYAGILEARHGHEAMERAMEDALEELSARLYRKIEYLNLIGAVAPMVGLFGTVYGIIGMFTSIAESGGVPVMSRISQDLGVALVATFWGLMIAIPTLVAFGLLRNRIDVLLAECAATAENLMAVFRPESAASLPGRMAHAGEAAVSG